MDTINEHLPDASFYCYSLLKDPLVTHYTNFKKRHCLGVSKQRGVAQGNPLSGTFFNANALRTIRSNHKSVNLLSFHGTFGIIA
jgi:hypothetical protein